MEESCGGGGVEAVRTDQVGYGRRLGGYVSVRLGGVLSDGV